MYDVSDNDGVNVEKSLRIIILQYASVYKL